MTKTDKLYNNLKSQLIAQAPGNTFHSVRYIMKNFTASQVTVTSVLQRLADEKLLNKNDQNRLQVTEAVLQYRKDAKPIYCLAIPLCPSEYYNSLEQAFLAQAAELEYELNILRYDTRYRVPQNLPQVKTDALIVVPATITGEDIETLNRFDVPYIIFGQEIEDKNVSTVGSDSQLFGSMAAEHLWKLGHRELALVLSEKKCNTLLARRNAFVEFARKHGCTVTEIDCDIQGEDFTPQKVYQVLMEYFRKNPRRCSAMYLLSEAGSYGFYRACHECGIKVPEDLSVLTLGNNWQLNFISPQLSSIGTNIAEMAKCAIDTLRSAISGKVRKRIITPQLFERTSTRKYQKS